MKRSEIIKDWVVSSAYVSGLTKDTREKTSFQVCLMVDEKERIVPHTVLYDPPYEYEPGQYLGSGGSCPIILIGLNEKPEDVSAEELELRYDCLAGLYSDKRFIVLDCDGNEAKDYSAWALHGLDEAGIEELEEAIDDCDLRDKEEMADKFGADEISLHILYDAVLKARRNQAEREADLA